MPTTGGASVFCVMTFRVRAARRPALRLVDPEQSDEHAQRTRHRRGPEHTPHAKSRKQHQRSQRPGNRPCGIHRLNQAVGRPQPLLRYRLRDHHIARGSAHSLGQPVTEPDQQNVPPCRHDGEQRLHRVRDKVSRHYKRLAAVDAVGEISRKKVWRTKRRFPQSLQSAPNCAGPAPNDTRNAGNTQYAISEAVSFRKEVMPKE